MRKKVEPMLCSHRVCQGKKKKGQNTALEWLFVLCFVSSFLCLPHVARQRVSLMGCEFQDHDTVNESKKSLHFAWIIVPYVCVFAPCSFVCVLFISKQVVRLFNAFQRFNAHSPWLWRMLRHPHLSYLIFQHSECLLFDILLYFVIAAEKYHNLWTCILYMWYWPHCARFRLTHRKCFLHTWNLDSFLCLQLSSLTPEHKMQSPKLAAIYWG